MAFRDFKFDVGRLWEPAANDEGAAPCVTKRKRKVCKKQVKLELKSLRRLTAPRDNTRRAWIVSRCKACGRCPSMAV